MPTYIVLSCFTCLILGYFAGSVVAGFTYGYKYRSLSKKLAKVSATQDTSNPYL